MIPLLLAVMTVDVINGLFEFGGAFMCWMHVKQILKDKKTRGVAWAPFIFFALWGVWNATIYYPAVGCWWSWAGGVALVLVNTFYCCLVWKYRKN
jgi:hypothetical protein